MRSRHVQTYSIENRHKELNIDHQNLVQSGVTSVYYGNGLTMVPKNIQWDVHVFIDSDLIPSNFVIFYFTEKTE